MIKKFCVNYLLKQIDKSKLETRDKAKLNYFITLVDYKLGG
ncbi:hypothetical protein SAG0181_11565 [Streptococcus agalactiae LDS 628]|nr:hypothetical protein [Streptococcus phage LF2]EPU47053.1 hypothetical protein SAG0181_11565 [Streptococcus agalactiae LDS 628]